jgi:hypothetical protein
MHVEPFDLCDGVNVDVSFSKTTLPSANYSDVLIVTVRGQTGIGCKSNTDAGYIEAMTRAALCIMRPAALILDFRKFEYEWGDLLCATLSAGDQQYVDSSFPTVVVASELCCDGLTSLIGDEMLAKPDDWLYDSLETGVEAVDRQRQEILELGRRRKLPPE